MTTIFKIIVSLTCIAFIVVSTWFLNGYISLQKQKLANDARYECAQSVRYEVKTDKTSISYPPDNLYRKCLREKGL